MGGWEKIRETLDGDGYFLCKKYSCKMSVADCVRRQKKIANWYANPLRSIAVDPGCEKCEQGRENRKMTKREITDNFYKLCECGKEASKPHNARVPKWCSECWGKKMSGKPRGKYRKRQKPDAPEPAITEFPDEKKEDRARWVYERTIGSEGVIIIIDFSDFPDVLESLKKEADDEVRTIEQQVLYILKTRKGIKEITE